MKGHWYIDDIDIYAKYGIGILEGVVDNLLVFPSFKETDVDDWTEEDGIDIDLSEVYLNNKTVDISFAILTSDNTRVDNFLSFITHPGYRTFKIASLGRNWILRVNKESARSIYPNAQTFTIQFTDDFPRSQFYDTYYVWGSEDERIISSEDGSHTILAGLNEGIIQEPKGHGVLKGIPQSEYVLDGLPLSNYGIVVEKGRESIYSMPEVKTQLERKSNFIDGLKYDTESVAFKSKDVTLECAFYCDTLNRFWSNYMAFFKKITELNQRRLYVSYTSEEYPCYYKSTSNFKFTRTSTGILCRFNLGLVVIKFRTKN